MDPLSISVAVLGLLKVAGTVLNSCYRFVGKVKDAESDVDRVMRHVGSLTAILEDLGRVCEEGKCTSKGLEGLGGENGTLARIEKCLRELEVRLVGAAGPMSFRRKLQWPLDTKKVREILDRITAEVPLVQLALDGDNHAKTEQILDAVQKTRAREEREDILNWLRCTDPTVKHVASRKLHQPGSNTWALNAAAFTEWKTTPGQVLWLHGIPGAGKTIICSTIIDHVEEICKAQPGARLAYYYFDFGDQSSQNLGHVLRCLLWQLSSQDLFVSAPVLDLYAASDNGRKQVSDERLASTLSKVLQGIQQAFIILDALDECAEEERHHFFDLLLDHIGSGPAKANFLITSRKEPDIAERMGELREVVKLHAMPVLTGDVATDIRLYVATQLSTQRATRAWDNQALRKEVEDTIAERAQGMFRWAHCQLELIKKYKQVRKVRETLKSLPPTLDATYDRILASIPDEISDIAYAALMLLTYSARPITLQEVAEAMVVDRKRGDFDADEDRLTSCREVLEICGSLVTVAIQENSGLGERIPWLAEKNSIEQENWVKAGQLEIVQFAHFTVKEYMVLQRCGGNASLERFSFSASQAHRSIAELSLVYLLTFSRGQRPSKIDFVAYPFLAYAARYWPEHWSRQLGDKEDQETVNSLIRRLFDTEQEPNSYVNFLNICRPDALLDSVYALGFVFRNRKAKSLDALPQPLYYAAQLGHPELCEWLIVKKGCDVNSRRGIFGQAIQLAARFGHAKVVTLLLDHGAEVNTLAGEYGYPLQAAAFGGHVETVRILLERGADVNGNGGKHGTALIAACSEGHVEAVRLLLNNGADVEGVSVRSGKALRVAAAAGNEAVVQLLLSRGAQVNDGSRGSGGSPLYAAAKEGNLGLVKFLVNAGADVNLWSDGEGTALMAACYDRRGEGEEDADDDTMDHDLEVALEVARYLVQCGADVNRHDESCGDALQAAVAATSAGNVEDNNIDLVTLLLEAGADISHTGGIYHSAMRAAVFCGNIAAAHALLDRGVEVNDEIFLLAVEGERETVIPRLLLKGVDVNAANEDGTALCFAIDNKDQTTIDALLRDSAIDINAWAGRHGHTALCMAIDSGNLALVKQLLALGADARALCGSGNTCLLHAVRSGNMPIIALLAERGLDINAGGSDGTRPLTVACGRGDEVLVRYLLDQGADINAGAPGHAPDALQEAAREGHENVVKLLLDRGADVKAPEGRQGSCFEGAIAAKSPALTRLLLDAGAHINFSRPRKDFDDGDLGFGGALSAAISNPQEGLLTELIKRGADVNFGGGSYYGTPLAQAVEQGRVDAVEVLLENGARVNQVGGHHGCALIAAILKSGNDPDHKLVRLLLDNGADVNMQCWDYGCPVAAAVGESNLRLVERLLDLGADVNAPAAEHGSPLMIAIREGDIDVFMLLLARGADVNALYEGQRRSALEVAGWRRSDTMFNELLAHGADVTLNGSAAVVACAEVGYTSGLIALLDRGANMHTQQGVPGKALHEAAWGGHLSTVRLLLERSVNVNSFGGAHGNALMAILSNFSARRENYAAPMLELLLDAGASVNSPPSEKYTSPLQAAIDSRHDAFAMRLLDNGAEANAHDPRLGTPLTAASFRGEVELMKKLVEMGADPSLAGQKYGSALQAAVRGECLPAVTYLLTLRTLDVNQCSGKRGFALHAACCLERGEDMVRLLLDHGADVNARGGKYETALQAAAAKGRLEVVKLLIRHGADPMVEGGKFGSPLKAALGEKRRHYHVANYLRRHLARMQAQELTGAATA